MAERIGDGWGLPGRRHLSYEDRIRTVQFEAGTRRMEARKAGQQAMAEIAEALRRGEGILPITELSRLSGVTRSEIYKILQREVEERDP
jgi:hypothetical protein